MKPSISLTGRPSKWQGLRWVSCMEDAGVLASVLGGGGLERSVGTLLVTTCSGLRGEEPSLSWH